jgi:hypothetical protein
MERTNTSKIAVLSVQNPESQRSEARSHAHFAPEETRRLGPGYSRFVGMMKVLLPVGAAILVAMVIAWPYLQPSDGRFRIGFSSLVASQAERPNIVNPRLIGTDEKNQPFSITAISPRISTAPDLEARRPVEWRCHRPTSRSRTVLAGVTATGRIDDPQDKMMELSGAGEPVPRFGL